MKKKMKVLVPLVLVMVMVLSMAGVAQAAPVELYGVTISDDHLDFGTIEPGYDASALAKTVTLTGRSGGIHGGRSYEMSSSNAGEFTVTPGNIDTLWFEPGIDRSFIVTPKSGLAPGTYTGSVSVISANHAEGTTSVTFTVTVAEEAPNPVLASITSSMPVVASARSQVIITVEGENLEGQTVGRFIGGEFQQSWTIDSSYQVNLFIPENETAEEVVHTFKVGMGGGGGWGWFDTPTVSVTQQAKTAGTTDPGTTDPGTNNTDTSTTTTTSPKTGDTGSDFPFVILGLACAGFAASMVILHRRKAAGEK